MKRRIKNKTLNPSTMMPERALYDKTLLSVAVCLLLIGVLMVASASIVMSEKLYGWPFHYLTRQAMYVIVGLVACGILFFIPTETWEKNSARLLVVVGVLLFLVLIPGIGRHVNGSARWLGFGPFVLQISELAKLAMVLYLASYLVRRREEVRTEVKGFLKPMAVMGVFALLLLAEPDFGATVVIVITGLAMMFMAGVRVRQFALLLLCVAVLLGLVAIASPYRLLRLSTFLHPWADQYGSGYQLTQSLIAFGRGGWFGVGLGDSVQKLFYLPEAHTDFLFAILAEELGLAGALVVIALYSVLVFRALVIAKRAADEGCRYAALVALGCGVWLGIQFLVNVGVSTGLLPTKGLTLPLMSYGGSSIVIDMAVIACLLRIDYESRLQAYGVRDIRELQASV